MFRRSRARAIVLQVLFEDDLNPQRNMAQSDQFLERRLRHFPEVIDFAQSLLSGVRRRRPDLDRVLAQAAQLEPEADVRHGPQRAALGRL